MSQRMPLIALVGAIIVIVAATSLFTVKEFEKAILLRLGEIERSDYDPGLHWKIPVINNVIKFDGRILTMDATSEEYLTVEKKNVIVDSFVKWRIHDVATYYRATGGGNERAASDRLAQIVKDGLRGEIGKRTIIEAVSGERAEIMDILRVNANKQASEFGIEIVDVRIKRIDLPEQVSESVYQRMEAERARVAKDFRSKGAEKAEIIRAEADRERTIILAEAYRDAETTRGLGDAIAADTYAQAFGQNSQFYNMYRSLVAYKSSFKEPSDVIVLDPDADFFRFFKDRDGERDNGPSAQTHTIGSMAAQESETRQPSGVSVTETDREEAIFP